MENVLGVPPPLAPAAITPDAALERLMAGNERWASGRAQHLTPVMERRRSLSETQSPFAVTFSCIDSRVPPEMIFDCTLGELLVVRSAGHTVDAIVQGSIEFGPCEFRTPLIVVLGHQRCGAVNGAIEAFRHDHWPPGHIVDVVEALRPAYLMAAQLPDGDLTEQMVRAQTMLTVARLKRDPVFAERLRTDSLRIIGGRYDLETAMVEIIA